MKHVDEYRDPQMVRGLAAAIKAEAARPMRFMELCGTHTVAIARHGLPSMLPLDLELVSGPGCPVCVTSAAEIDVAVGLAAIDGLCVATFGDMIRVPGSGGSLAQARAQGADVQVIYSALDAVQLAAQDPGRQVAFLGIGFETHRAHRGRRHHDGQGPRFGQFQRAELPQAAAPGLGRSIGRARAGPGRLLSAPATSARSSARRPTRRPWSGAWPA